MFDDVPMPVELGNESVAVEAVATSCAVLLLK